MPTAAGTGSETTGIAIFDYQPIHAKAGIAHRRLKPTLGLLDPDNTRTLPPEVAASPGLDVVSHAIESYTALPYARRPRPERAATAPGLPGGSNPISDVWSEAHGFMLLAAAYAAGRPGGVGGDVRGRDGRVVGLASWPVPGVCTF